MNCHSRERGNPGSFIERRWVPASAATTIGNERPMTSRTTTADEAATTNVKPSVVRLFFDLFKLRIGLVIGFTAVAGLAVTPGPSLPGWQILALALAVTLASAAAGAFNQYVERDLDATMGRTRRRAFVTGRLTAGPAWLAAIVAIGAAGVALAAFAINVPSALYTFAGAFTYGVVYTVWLKRRRCRCCPSSSATHARPARFLSAPRCWSPRRSRRRSSAWAGSTWPRRSAA